MNMKDWCCCSLLPVGPGEGGGGWEVGGGVSKVKLRCILYFLSYTEEYFLTSSMNLLSFIFLSIDFPSTIACVSKIV